MFGAVVGDVIGSVYEWHNIKTKNFPLFSPDCTATDDSVMTVAVASALMKSSREKRPFREVLIEDMQSFGRRYPNYGYGGMFAHWISNNNPQPYNSFGNGSGMRVSPCGLIADTLDEALSLAEASADAHNHPEGVKGAQAVAAAVFLAKSGKSKRKIKRYISKNFYQLKEKLDDIRPYYDFDVICQGSVPQAIIAFLESVSFEDAIRNAISIGGDSDTIAAVTGAIAWEFYKKTDYESMSRIAAEVEKIIPEEFANIIQDFEKYTGI